MRMPTQDEAVEIYADYLTARHGGSAFRYARKTVDKLQRNGDLAGYTAWNRVSDTLERKARKIVDFELVVSVL